LHLGTTNSDTAHLPVIRFTVCRVSGCALFALLVATAPAFSQTTVWTDGNGDWFTPANWSAGVPNANTSALINNGGNAQITASGGAAGEVEIGVGAQDSGSLSISGPGDLQDGGSVYVGRSGTGNFDITNGGVVASIRFVIGENSGSNGTATVSGSGSMWMNDAVCFVGFDGNGTLSITSGGQLSNLNRTAIGGNGTGNVTVDGVGSTWNANAGIDIGGPGPALLTISNGGHVLCSDSAVRTGNVTVEGVGSTWTISGDFSIGGFVGGAAGVTIRESGQVTSANAFIGEGFSSIGIVGIDGAASTWTDSGNIYVGGDDTGAVGIGELILMNGGTVAAPVLTVWNSSTLSGNGTVQTNKLVNQGTLIPDQTISITGTLTFGLNARMRSTVTPQTAGSVIVQGDANLHGNLNVTLTGGPFTVGTQYTLLEANGDLNGTTFSNVSIIAPPGVKSQVTYDTNHVYLTIKSTGTPTPTPTPSPTASPTPTATATSTATATPTPSLTPTPTASSSPCAGRCSPTPRPRLTPPPRP
jgi:T5SS/PEP-CTERM-associated repeat protein